VLGRVAAARGEVTISLERPRQRTVLAYLLLNRRRVAATERLIEAVWADRPPGTARAQIQTDIAALRRQLGPGLDLSSVSGGYHLDLDPDQLDLDLFQQHVEAARTLADTGPEAAVVRLRAALALWRGTALDGVSAAFVDDARVNLDEQRLRAYERLADLELDLDRAADVVVDLDAWVRAEPLRESLRSRLMIALYRTGRQAEALAVMRSYRRLLADEHGLDPGPELRATEDMILRGRPDRPRSPAQATGTVSRRPPTRYVPRDIADFTGRTAELGRLDAFVAGASAAGGAVVAIAGPGGMGKTALAVHWAHRRADLFPDGQLFVDMRSHGRDPELTADDAIAQLLRQLGHAPDRIPRERVHARELYRSSLAGRRLLIVVDNAGTVEQVRPLLASTGCVTLVTSRARLAGLVARDGAHPLALGEMTDDDAGRLVVRLVGERGTREPDAVADLVQACGHLPLALRIAAANVVSRTSSTVADQVSRLRSGDRLSALRVEDDPDSNLRVVFDQSYDALGDGAGSPLARMFRLLGTLPGPDISVRAAAGAAAVSPGEALRYLDALCAANLLVERSPHRFVMHDLIRAYAAEIAASYDSSQELADARIRFYDYCLHTAHAAGLVRYPARRTFTLDPPVDGITVDRFDSEDDAYAWFEAEHRVLVAAIRSGGDDGPDLVTINLTQVLVTYLDRAGHWADRVTTNLAALRCAQRSNVPAEAAYLHISLGFAYVQMAELDLAIEQFTVGMEINHALGNVAEEARAHVGLTHALEPAARYAEAAFHSDAAADLYRGAGNQMGLARALNAAGWCHARMGSYDLALNRCLEAVSLFGASIDRHGEAGTWDSLGYIHHQTGAYAEATRCFHRAIDIYRSTGDVFREAETLMHLAASDLDSGCPDDANRHADEAMAVMEAHQHPAADAIRKLHPIGVRVP
jgi:DNA-binding SARP family transcriptional activator